MLGSSMNLTLKVVTFKKKLGEGRGGWAATVHARNMNTHRSRTVVGKS